MADGEELFGVVGQEFAADVEPADGLLAGSGLVEGGDGGVGVSGVDDEEAFGWDGRLGIRG